MRATSSLSLTLILFVLSSGVFGQDDESRQQSGLPTFIGTRPGANSNPAFNASLTGTVTIQGLDEQEHQPTIVVVVLSNGSVAARQTVKNRGAFSLSGLARENATVIVELDGLEANRMSLQTLNPPPLSNRVDIILTAAQVSQTLKRLNEVVSVRNAYVRSEAANKALARAVAAYRAKQFDESEKALRQLAAEDAKDFVVLTELGNVLFLKEKYRDAENTYGQVLSLKADFVPALLNLGKLHLSQMHPDKAVEVLERAVALASDSADVNHYLGEAYLQIKKGSKAVGFLNKAIELAPIEKAELHLRLAALYNGANLKDRAITEYRMYLQKVPNSPDREKIEKYIRDNSPK